MVSVRDPFSGYSHLLGCVLGVVGFGALLQRTHGGAGARASVCVYGACLVALYAASAAYHLILTSDRGTRALHLLDHVAIFLMVAGTCTPLYYRAFTGGLRVAMLCGIWGAAVFGIASKVLWRRAPRALSTAVYVAMGWAVLLRADVAFRALPVLASLLILAGGVAYTMGAVVYTVKRPDPLPAVFGFHEIWHLFVLAGSALHFAAIALVT